MHPAIIKRRDQLIAQGKDPGPFYQVNGKDYSYIVSARQEVAPTLYGRFVAELGLPDVDSAWFYADAEHAGFFDAPPSPPPTGLVLGTDVSNYQPTDLSALIAQYGFKHVVVRLWLPEEHPNPQISLDQIHSSLDNGCTVSGYYWAYPTLQPEKSINDAMTLWMRANVGNPAALWSDVEVYEGEGCVDQDWTLRACQYAKAAGLRTGVYTSDYMIKSYWDHWLPEIDEYLSWLANYNQVPNLDIPSQYFTHVDAHQYNATQVPVPLDFDVFKAEVTI